MKDLIHEYEADAFERLAPGAPVTTGVEDHRFTFSWDSVLRWSDEERAARGLYLVDRGAIPDGEQEVSRSWARVAGVVVEQLVTEPIPGWEPPPAPRRYVSRYAIVSRLEAMERLDDALDVFDQLPRPLRERWSAAVEIWSEDPDTIAALSAAGLSGPEIEEVLAP